MAYRVLVLENHSQFLCCVVDNPVTSDRLQTQSDGFSNVHQTVRVLCHPKANPLFVTSIINRPEKNYEPQSHNLNQLAFS